MGDAVSAAAHSEVKASPQPGASALHSGIRVFISPVAKKLAAEAELDYRQICGTGPNGRIVNADVQKYALEQRANPRPAVAGDEEENMITPYSSMGGRHCSA